MFLSRAQAVVLRDVLTALHLRDEALGMWPAVDRGPPRGLVDAAVASVADGSPLPDLSALPPNLFYASRACQLLAAHLLTTSVVEPWLARNLRAALEPVDAALEARMPIGGCRSHEDVRNRMLVDIDDMPTEALAWFDHRVHHVLGLELDRA